MLALPLTVQFCTILLELSEMKIIVSYEGRVAETSFSIPHEKSSFDSLFPRIS